MHLHTSILSDCGMILIVFRISILLLIQVWFIYGKRNFDWDNDGHILVVSRYKQGIMVPISNEDEWVESRIG